LTRNALTSVFGILQYSAPWHLLPKQLGIEIEIAYQSGVKEFTTRRGEFVSFTARRLHRQSEEQVSLTRAFWVLYERTNDNARRELFVAANVFLTVVVQPIPIDATAGAILDVAFRTYRRGGSSAQSVETHIMGNKADINVDFNSMSASLADDSNNWRLSRGLTEDVDSDIVGSY
jgi:hypothetical protein